MKRRIIISIIILLAAFTILLVMLYYPKDISINTEGIKYQLGNENRDTVKTIKIEINGKLYRSITGNKSFVGTIYLEGEGIPVPIEHRGLNIKFGTELQGGINYFYYDELSKPKTFTLGGIYINEDFSEFTIFTYDRSNGSTQGSWSADNGYMISAPAKDRDEALKISNELMKNILNGYILK